MIALLKATIRGLPLVSVHMRTCVSDGTQRESGMGREQAVHVWGDFDLSWEFGALAEVAHQPQLPCSALCSSTDGVL